MAVVVTSIQLRSCSLTDSDSGQRSSRKLIPPCFALLCSSHISKDASLVSIANDLDMMRFNPYHSSPSLMSRATDSTSEVACDSPTIPHRASFAFVRLYSHHRWAHLAEGRSFLCCCPIDFRQQYANAASNPSTVRCRRRRENHPPSGKDSDRSLDTKILDAKKTLVWSARDLQPYFDH